MWNLPSQLFDLKPKIIREVDIEITHPVMNHCRLARIRWLVVWLNLECCIVGIKFRYSLFRCWDIDQKN